MVAYDLTGLEEAIEPALLLYASLIAILPSWPSLILLLLQDPRDLCCFAVILRAATLALVPWAALARAL